MPATPDRIARITRAFQPVIAGPEPAVAAAYGNAARDNLEPVETFFETVADTQAMADERLALMGATRRRFAVGIATPDAALALDPLQAVPTVRLIDDDRGFDGSALALAWSIDLQTDECSIKVWG